MKNFYQRVHAPTLGTTLGTFLMLAGSITCFSVLHGRPVFHEILIGVFLTVTTPITLMLLVRAALYRDREEGSDYVPQAPRHERSEEHTSELQSLMRISYAVFCLKKKKHEYTNKIYNLLASTIHYITNISQHLTCTTNANS